MTFRAGSTLFRPKTTFQPICPVLSFTRPLDNSISHNNQKVSNLRLETMLRFEKDFSKKVKRERFCSFLQHFLSKLGKFCERTHPSNYQQKAMPRR